MQDSWRFIKEQKYDQIALFTMFTEGSRGTG